MAGQASERPGASEGGRAQRARDAWRPQRAGVAQREPDVPHGVVAIRRPHARAQCQLAPAPLWPLGNDSAEGRRAAPGEARFGEPVSAQDIAEHETQTETAQQRFAANDAARSEQHSAGAGSTDPADLVGSGAAQTSDTGACRGERGDAASASGRQAAPGEARFGEPVPARSTAEHEAETEHET